MQIYHTTTAKRAEIIKSEGFCDAKASTDAEIQAHAIWMGSLVNVAGSGHNTAVASTVARYPHCKVISVYI